VSTSLTAYVTGSGPPGTSMPRAFSRQLPFSGRLTPMVTKFAPWLTETSGSLELSPIVLPDGDVSVRSKSDPSQLIAKLACWASAAMKAVASALSPSPSDPRLPEATRSV
jgi:hypothetical protein